MFKFIQLNKMINKIKKWLYLQKEGIAVGAVIAGILYWMNWTLPIKLPYEGIPKLIIMIIILGGIGGVIDALYKPNR